LANDILALGGDEIPEAPAATKASIPRAVPELDENAAMALAYDGSSIANDFFTSSRGKPKKSFWKLTR